MKNIIIIVLFFFLNNVLLGQTEKVQIYLKNGSSEYFDLKEVKLWGLINNEGIGASFIVIDSLKISNKSLVDSILLQFVGADFYISKGKYIVDISNSKRKFINKTEKSKFIPKAISVYYSINKIEQLVFKLEYDLGLIENLNYKFEGSFSFNSNKFFPVDQNFGFGFLYISKINFMELGLGMGLTNFNNYANKSGEFKSVWIESLDASLICTISGFLYFFASSI